MKQMAISGGAERTPPKEQTLDPSPPLPTLRRGPARVCKEDLPSEGRRRRQQKVSKSRDEMDSEEGETTEDESSFPPRISQMTEGNGSIHQEKKTMSLEMKGAETSPSRMDLSMADKGCFPQEVKKMIPSDKQEASEGEGVASPHSIDQQVRNRQDEETTSSEEEEEGDASQYAKNAASQRVNLTWIGKRCMVVLHNISQQGRKSISPDKGDAHRDDKVASPSRTDPTRGSKRCSPQEQEPCTTSSETSEEEEVTSTTKRARRKRAKRHTLQRRKSASSNGGSTSEDEEVSPKRRNAKGRGKGRFFRKMKAASSTEVDSSSNEEVATFPRINKNRGHKRQKTAIVIYSSSDEDIVSPPGRTSKKIRFQKIQVASSEDGETTEVDELPSPPTRVQKGVTKGKYFKEKERTTSTERDSSEDEDSSETRGNPHSNTSSAEGSSTTISSEGDTSSDETSSDDPLWVPSWMNLPDNKTMTSSGQDSSVDEDAQSLKGASKVDLGRGRKGTKTLKRKASTSTDGKSSQERCVAKEKSPPTGSRNCQRRSLKMCRCTGRKDTSVSPLTVGDRNMKGKSSGGEGTKPPRSYCNKRLPRETIRSSERATQVAMLPKYWRQFATPPEEEGTSEEVVPCTTNIERKRKRLRNYLKERKQTKAGEVSTQEETVGSPSPVARRVSCHKPRKATGENASLSTVDKSLGEAVGEAGVGKPSEEVVGNSLQGVVGESTEKQAGESPEGCASFKRAICPDLQKSSRKGRLKLKKRTIKSIPSRTGDSTEDDDIVILSQSPPTPKKSKTKTI